MVLHQLRRVEKGLRGIVLGPELDSEGELGLGLSVDAGLSEASVRAEGVPVGELQHEQAQAAPHRGAREELQSHGAPIDLDGGMTATLDDAPIENYQEQLRDQGFGIKEGEIGDRGTGVASGPAARPPVVHATRPNSAKKRGFEEVDGVGDGAGRGRDKEARKRAKRERDLERRRGEQRKKQEEGGLISGESQVVNWSLEHEETEEHEDGPILDETRELHDEAGPYSTFNADKVTSNAVTVREPHAVATSDSQPNGVDQPTQPSGKSSKRENKKRRRQSQIEEASGPQPEPGQPKPSKADPQTNQPMPSVKSPQPDSRPTSPTLDRSKKHKRRDKHKSKASPEENETLPRSSSQPNGVPQVNGNTSSTQTKKRRAPSASPQRVQSPSQSPSQSPNLEQPPIATHEKKRRKRRKDTAQPASSDKATPPANTNVPDSPILDPGTTGRSKEVDDQRGRWTERKSQKKERNEERHRAKMEKLQKEGRG